MDNELLNCLGCGTMFDPRWSGDEALCSRCVARSNVDWDEYKRLNIYKKGLEYFINDCKPSDMRTNTYHDTKRELEVIKDKMRLMTQED